MKKIMLACVIGSVLLLTGCKDSAIKKAQDLISNGDYKAAVEVLEQYADDETAAPILKQAQLESTIIDAQASIDAKDYSTAVSLLEDFKEESKALELYNSAKLQVYIEQLDGKWQNCGGETLNGAFVEIKFDNGEGTAVLKHSVDNYYGYRNDDVMWKTLNVSADGMISLSALERDIDNTSKYTDTTAVFNLNDNTITFSNDFFGNWKKITDTEAVSASNNDPKLTKTFDGTPIQKSPNALKDFGKRRSELPGQAFGMYDENYSDSGRPYVYLYYRSEIDSYPDHGYIYKGGALSDDIYCGMTMSQVVSLQEQGVITDFNYRGQCEHDYDAFYQCTYNGNVEKLSLIFNFDEADKCVANIEFFSANLYQLSENEYAQWEYQKQQEEERRRAEEEAKKDIAYSTDGLLYYFGSVIEYVSSSNGRVAVCEPSFMTNFYLGNICFIENYSALDNTLVLNSQGYLRKTNRSVTYKGTTYPVYRAVKVIQ